MSFLEQQIHRTESTRVEFRRQGRGMGEGGFCRGTRCLAEPPAQRCGSTRWHRYIFLTLPDIAMVMDSMSGMFTMKKKEEEEREKKRRTRKDFSPSCDHPQSPL